MFSTVPRIWVPICALGAALFCVSLAGTANAQSLNVNAADDIYGAGQNSDPGGGNLPSDISLDPADDYISFSSITGSITCDSAEGCVTINGGGNDNDPDGVGASPSVSINYGYGSLSGITAPGGGYLVGVFVDGTPSGDAPAALDFTQIGTDFTSLSPELDQVFFIGDGLTGDGSGSEQEFNVPTGATALYLGIADACGYNGAPGCFGDNSGNYTVDYSVNTLDASATPEPASVWLTLAGIAVCFFAFFRPKAASRS